MCLKVDELRYSQKPAVQFSMVQGAWNCGLWSAQQSNGEAPRIRMPHQPLRNLCQKIYLPHFARKGMPNAYCRTYVYIYIQTSCEETYTYRYIRFSNANAMGQHMHAYVHYADMFIVYTSLWEISVNPCNVFLCFTIPGQKLLHLCLEASGHPVSCLPCGQLSAIPNYWIELNRTAGCDNCWFGKTRFLRQ